MKIYRFIYRIEAKNLAQAKREFEKDMAGAYTDNQLLDIFHVEEIETQSAMEKAMENFDLSPEDL